MSSKRRIIPYNSNLKELARDLRKKMTLSEVLLWNQLKSKNMMGFDFDRQRPIGNYIVDFYCKELSLAIEIDGSTHIYRDEEDERRQADLENQGVRFLRFEDIEVKKNISNVLRTIEGWISNNQPTPNPSKEGNLIDKVPVIKNRIITEKLNDNLAQNDLSKENQPTPNPSREGNLIDKVPVIKNRIITEKLNDSLAQNDLSKENQPTPNPSREGNLID